MARIFSAQCNIELAGDNRDRYINGNIMKFFKTPLSLNSRLQHVNGLIIIY